MEIAVGVHRRRLRSPSMLDIPLRCVHSLVDRESSRSPAFHRRQRRNPIGSSESASAPTGLTRRRFFLTAASLAAVALAGLGVGCSGDDEDEPQGGLRLADIQIRDPFILTDRGQGRYYMFGSTDQNIWSGPGTGFDCYRSKDLLEWHGPTAAFRPPADFWSTSQFWAPEVHRYEDAWFMFATFAVKGGRGTAVLRADQPEGPYRPWSDGPVTPGEWLSLDGTLYVDAEARPWMVFCHEWLQVQDGEVCAVRLTSDLRAADGEPVVLFRGSDAPWARPLQEPKPGTTTPYVTDGPFLHTTRSGELLMLWSSFGHSGYAMGVARSSDGHILGPWSQDESPLWAENGGHGMLFRTLDDDLRLTFHSPNETPNERAVIVPVREQGSTLRL